MSNWAQKSVDLGLSVKWADRNIGAEQPTDSGDYFNWGDPSGKLDPLDIFAAELEVTDIVGTTRDIATINMGCNWRMPTSDELHELREKCVWSLETKYPIPCFRVTGPNGNSIFLPICGGYDRGKFLVNEGSGLWSGSYNHKYNRIDFMLLMFDEDGRMRVQVRQATMRYKFNVRAVCE